ncbi:MAG: hypothetical protein KBD78_06810 [Oligoflexales bacterium]|nr:hypothetical protein [Oligoflexales bacterium]
MKHDSTNKTANIFKLINHSFIALTICSSATTALSQDGMSASNRQNKQALVAAEVIGLTMFPVSGIRAGYFVDSNLIAEIGFASGSATINDDWKINKTVIEAKARYFFGNSFYVSGGLGTESFAVDYPVVTQLDEAGLVSKQFSADVNSFGINTHIGNQWQWEGFMIGVDWLGYYLPLSKSSSFKADSDVSAEAKKIEEDDIKSTYESASLHLTRFYMGWAF